MAYRCCASLGSYLTCVGSKVTIFEASDTILGILDSECRKIILKEFDRLAINVITNVNIGEVAHDAQEISLYYGDKLYQGSHLLIAARKSTKLTISLI